MPVLMSLVWVSLEAPVGMSASALQNMQSKLKSSNLEVAPIGTAGSFRKNRVMFHDSGVDSGENSGAQEEAGEEYDKYFIKITGMTCSSCVANVERHVMKMEGQ